jgi:hypothetical protein
MIQPETWKMIHEDAAKAWNVLGPFVGIGVGAWLGRSWDRKRWLADKRAEECRELISALAHSVSQAFNAKHGVAERGMATSTEIDAADKAHKESLKVMQDRIFIAADVNNSRLRERWVQAMRDFYTNGDHKELQSQFELVKSTIISWAMK